MTILILKDLLKFTENHMNEIVLDCTAKTKRLVGCAIDNDDYYYILKSLDNDQYENHSCCGNLILLKDKIPNEDYEYINNIFKFNNVIEENEHIFKDYRKKD